MAYVWVKYIIASQPEALTCNLDTNKTSKIHGKHYKILIEHARQLTLSCLAILFSFVASRRQVETRTQSPVNDDFWSLIDPCRSQDGISTSKYTLRRYNFLFVCKFCMLTHAPTSTLILCGPVHVQNVQIICAGPRWNDAHWTLRSHAAFMAYDWLRPGDHALVHDKHNKHYRRILLFIDALPRV